MWFKAVKFDRDLCEKDMRLEHYLKPFPNISLIFQSKQIEF